MPRSDRPVALVWPPAWVSTTVSADLTDTGGALAARGVPVRLWDLSAGLARHLLGHDAGWAALRRWETYRQPDRHRAAARALEVAAAEVGRRHGVCYGPRRLEFPDVDEDHVAGSWKVGLDPARNPALPYLAASARRILAQEPALVAIGLGYPSQRTSALVLARLLEGVPVVLYGSLQDEIAPEDFAPDLVGEPRHLLFRDVGGVVLGEAESALLALWRGEEAPNLLRPGGSLPARRLEDLGKHPPSVFAGIDPEDCLAPAPVVDLRLGRGCPWGRCTFCAIHLHQPGYRSGPVRRVVEGMARAHDALGSRYFRLRDDLLTPAQLRALADAVAELDFQPRWSARVRFEDALGGATLARAARAGLDELWIGLESASERVRALMDKGVARSTVERVLEDAAQVGIRVRALCMLGHPGETLAEAHETLDFVLANQHRLASASISLFQLMRRSPLAQDPARHGIRLLPDSLPRHARLRYALPATWPGRLSREEVAALLRRVEGELLPWIAGELSPDAVHGWMGAREARAG